MNVQALLCRLVPAVLTATVEDRPTEVDAPGDFSSPHRRYTSSIASCTMSLAASLEPITVRPTYLRIVLSVVETSESDFVGHFSAPDDASINDVHTYLDGVVARKLIHPVRTTVLA